MESSSSELTIQPVLDFTLIRVSGMTITVGGLLLALAVGAAVWLVSRLVKRALTRYATRHQDVSEAALYSVSRLVSYVFWVGGVLMALDVAGVPLGKFGVFAGALGVGLGFGLQAIFNNFVSGIILLFERSLKVGDFVELEGGLRGTVCAIDIRATRITTNDDIDILVPNSEFVNGRVVNWTLRDLARRQKISFGVAYGTDKELVKKAALEAAASVPYTLALEGLRAPQVRLAQFGDSSLNFQLVVWLNDEATRHPGEASAAYNWALLTALEKYKIEIPFPQREVRVRSWAEPAKPPM